MSSERPPRTYVEELLAAGLPSVTYHEGFERWGLPNLVYRPNQRYDPATYFELFTRRNHPDTATVFVDDDQDGLWMAVLEPNEQRGA